MKRSWAPLLAAILVAIIAVIAVLFGPFLAVVMRGSMCDYSLERTFDLFIEFAVYILPTGAIIGVVGGLIVGGGVALAKQFDKLGCLIIVLGSLSVTAGLLYGCNLGAISLIADCL